MKIREYSRNIAIKLRRHWWIYLIFIILFTILVSMIYLLSEIKTTEILVYNYVIFIITLISTVIISEGLLRLAKRIFIKKAEEEELSKEDDVLLQATAFSQSALFIYLNLLPKTELIQIFKGLVPTVAIIFYVIRAIAKIRNNNKYRFNSMYALLFLIAITINSLLLTYLEFHYIHFNKFQTFIITILINGLIIYTPLDFFGSIFRRRYGLPEK